MVVGGMVAYQYVGHSQILWHLVSQRCARDIYHKPCVVYNVSAGYALLKDRVGKGQYLLLPTRPMHGIEEDHLLIQQAPFYFDQAWQERHWVSRAYGQVISDAIMSLAINSQRVRSQGQLHIHIDCMRSAVFEALRYYERHPMKQYIIIENHAYKIWRVPDLSAALSRRLAKDIFVNQHKTQRSVHGLFMAQLTSGVFVIVDVPTQGIHLGNAEGLQDHTCRLVREK